MTIHFKLELINDAWARGRLNLNSRNAFVELFHAEQHLSTRKIYQSQHNREKADECFVTAKAHFDNAKGYLLEDPQALSDGRILESYHRIIAEAASWFGPS